jgi:hypothetical protein
VVQLKLEKPDPTRPVRRDGITLVPESHWQRSATVELSDGSRQSVPFQIGQLPPGIHPAWKTLVIHPENVSPDNFVETVAPARRREDGTAAFVCDTISQSELSTRSFADYRLVALLNPEPLSDAVWGELRRFVEQGGGLFCCLGHNAAPPGADPSPFNTPAAQQVLPGELTHVWRAPEGGVFLSPSTFSHPVLAEFRGQASSIRWNRLPVFFHWGVQRSLLDEGEPPLVLLRFSNRQPALMEKQIGKGHVLMMTTPITEPPRPADHSSWNELFYGDEHWAGWLLVLQSAQYLVQTDAETLNYEVDQTVVLPNDDNVQPQEYWLFSPRNEEPVRLRAESNQLRYRFTNVPGHYRLRGIEDGRMLRGFSVNLRADATQLERLEKAQLDQIMGTDRYRLARGQSEIEREQGVARIGQEFYPLLALVVAALLSLELLMANLFYSSTRSTSPATATPLAAAVAAPSRR